MVSNAQVNGMKKQIKAADVRVDFSVSTCVQYKPRGAKIPARLTGSESFNTQLKELCG